MNVASGPRSAGLGPSLLLFVVAVGVFSLLHQRAMHGEDTRLFVLWLGAGERSGLYRHFLFLPVVEGLGAVLRPFGASWFTVLWVAAAGGTSLGLVCLHRAARLLLPPDAAMWLPVALALVPGWFFFATAAEVHGLFVLPLGLAWWAFARWSVRPTWVRAGGVGIGCGLAAALHFSGYALLPSLVATAWLLRLLPFAAFVGHAAVMSAALLVTVTVSSLTLGLTPWVQFTAAVQFGESWSDRLHGDEVLGVVFREFVRPFLPWSVIAVLFWRLPAARPWALAALVTLALHAVPPILALANPERLVEHGAYATAFAVPLVLLALHGLSRRAFVAGVVASAGLALCLQVGRLVPVFDPDFVTSVQALRAERGPLALIVGSHSTDMEALTIGLEDQLYIDSDKVQAWFGDPLGLPLPQWFDAMTGVLAGGRTLVVCASGREAFAQHGHAAVRALWDGHLVHAYTIEAIERPALRAWVLVPRKH
jgi:hypothetical protein